MINSWLRALVFLSITTLSAYGADIPAVARDLLATDWSSVDIQRVVETQSVDGASAQISAAIGDQYSCSPLRVITFLETVRAGDCRRCLRLEFLPTETQVHYGLASLILDFTASEQATVTSLVRMLMLGAGSPESLIDIPRKIGHSEQSRSWTVPNEMRSLDIRISHEAKGWRVHFDHRRRRVEGVPATP